MAANLPLIGPVAIPAGATAGDVIFRHIGVVRGGSKVAGGEFMGMVDMATGELRDANGQPVIVPVLSPGNFTDRHPFLEVNISWRGGGVGYTFMVDLMVTPDKTGVDIREAPGGGKVVVIAELSNNLSAMLNRADALLPLLEQQAARAATAADFAFGTMRGQIYNTFAELNSAYATDGTWASVNLHTFFHRENGAWVAKNLGRQPIRLNAVTPKISSTYSSNAELATTNFFLGNETWFIALKSTSFDTLEVPVIADGPTTIAPIVEVYGADGTLIAKATNRRGHLQLGKTLTFSPGERFYLRQTAGDQIYMLYDSNERADTTDGALRRLDGVSSEGYQSVRLAIQFVQGEAFPAEVVGVLEPAAFPAVATDDDVPAGGTARVGNELKYRTMQNELVSIGGGSGAAYTTENPLPLAALEQGSVIARLGQAGGVATLAADGKVPAAQLPVTMGGGLSAVVTTTNLRGAGSADAPLDVSADIAGLPNRIAALENASQVVPTYARSLIAIGDSITYGDQVGGPVGAWPAALCSLRGWTLTTNAGINGSELISGGTTPMVERWGSVVPAGYDGHVTLMAGTNDYNMSRPLGNPGTTDTATIYGALLAIGRGILNKAPAAMLHLLTPLWRGDSARAEGNRNNAGYTLEQVRQAVRDTAARLSREYPHRVQLVDAGHTLTDWMNAGTAYMNSDLLHPNAAGHQLIAQHLSLQLDGADKSLPPVTLLYSADFATLVAGNLSGQGGWTAYNGAAAAVDGLGLHLNAPFDSNPRGVLHALPANARHIRARLVLPPIKVAGVAIMRAMHRLSDDMALCAWSYSTARAEPVLDWGIIQKDSVTSWLPNGAPALPADCWLELAVNGTDIELRYWDAAEQRPAAPQYTHANPNITPDAFGFSTIGAGTQIIKAVQVS